MKESFSPTSSDRNASAIWLRKAQPSAEVAGGRLVTTILYVEDNDDNVYMLKMRFELLRRTSSSSRPKMAKSAAPRPRPSCPI